MYRNNTNYGIGSLRKNRGKIILLLEHIQHITQPTPVVILLWGLIHYFSILQANIIQL